VTYGSEAAKQNQKFPFHFLSAPPTPPAEEKKKGKENFWVLLPRPKGEKRILGALKALYISEIVSLNSNNVPLYTPSVL